MRSRVRKREYGEGGRERGRIARKVKMWEIKRRERGVEIK